MKESGGSLRSVFASAGALAAIVTFLHLGSTTCLACPPSYSPAESFELVIDSVTVNGENVAVDPAQFDTVDIIAAPDSQFDIFNPAGHGRYGKQ